ncbi:peroxisomal N(1)-acetyl-spermine/spermidine oxidase-like [Mizuhopecten yessoensis]|uniref:peroxisomal N(1)-acetyl-spermine/spermidine oxidase-like n=1 Tax=Mizuhopecten yessoensis TaxID=6573 RepID=UPI000B4579AD|nr:peroxisomal N(1)-acetyl-spermine/spermidine oxidase-like [Mizuhopecten yessoensis]
MSSRIKDICRTLTKVEEENHGAALEDVTVFIPDSITPGNNISLKGGYYALIPRLAHMVTETRIHLKTKVINIESENGAIMYKASHVIVTNYLGVLQYHQILFNPSLPFVMIVLKLKLEYGTATDPNTLDVWLCGEDGKEIETISNDVIARVITTVLRQFSNDQTIPEPDSILKTYWFSNRQFRGSYFYIRFGLTV